MSSPAPIVQDLTTPLYLHRQVDKVIVQSDHREETVIQAVPDDKAQDKDVTTVEIVKSPIEDEANSTRQRDIQVISTDSFLISFEEIFCDFQVLRFFPDIEVQDIESRLCN